MHRTPIRRQTECRSTQRREGLRTSPPVLVELDSNAPLKAHANSVPRRIPRALASGSAVEGSLRLFLECGISKTASHSQYYVEGLVRAFNPRAADLRRTLPTLTLARKQLTVAALNRRRATSSSLCYCCIRAYSPPGATSSSCRPRSTTPPLVEDEDAVGGR